MTEVTADEAVYWFDTKLRKVHIHIDGHWGKALVHRSGLVLEFDWRSWDPWPWIPEMKYD